MKGRKMKVVPYELSMADAIRQICLKTAGDDLSLEQQIYTLAMYCDGYLENGICYVLVDDENTPKGYILCEQDYREYEKRMEPVLEQLQSLPPIFGAMAAGEMAGYAVYRSEYPAHLHMDILEECTHCGGGTMLMEAVIRHLKEIGAPGLMLMASTGNQRAIAFYKKCGMHILSANHACVMMGLQFLDRK